MPATGSIAQMEFTDFQNLGFPYNFIASRNRWNPFCLRRVTRWNFGRLRPDYCPMLEPSGGVFLKGLTIEHRVPVLIHKTPASPILEMGIIHLCNLLKAIRKCLHPNIIMLQAPFSSRAFNESYLVSIYPISRPLYSLLDVHSIALPEFRIANILLFKGHLWLAPHNK
jgi:hypothetical protein